MLLFFKNILVFWLIYTNFILAQEIKVHIIDNNNIHQDESKSQIDKAFFLFKTLHASYAHMYPENIVEKLFNDEIELIKSSKAKLFLALIDNQVIGSIFAVYNSSRHMTQLRFLGFDQGISQENCINAFKNIIKNIKNTEAADNGICCVMNKKINNYMWLIENLNLIKNPSLFMQDKFSQESHEWYSTAD